MPNTPHAIDTDPFVPVSIDDALLGLRLALALALGLALGRFLFVTRIIVVRTIVVVLFVRIKNLSLPAAAVAVFRLRRIRSLRRSLFRIISFFLAAAKASVFFCA